MKSGVLIWLPRILSVLLIIFISLFALDVLGAGYGFPEVAIALFMHLIPTFVLIAITAVAWKRDRIGGLLFLGTAIIFTVFFRAWTNLGALVVLIVPLLVIGFLFLLASTMKKQPSALS